MIPQAEKSQGPPPPGHSSAAAVVVLLGIAAAVLFVLPRWAVTPVVTTAATPSPSVSLGAAPPTMAPLEMPPPPGTTMPSETEPPRPAVPIAREDRPAVTVAPAPASDFDSAVSEGLAALDRGAATDARAAFARAEALRPGTEVVKDGLARSEAGLRAQALEGHRQRGQESEAAEDWRGALREYEAALAIDPAVRFAVEGTLRAKSRADASDRLDAYLRRPERLATEEVAREAEIALDRASEIPSPGPKLQRQIQQLRAQLDAFAVAVTVRLISDERTDVSVLRVGALGRFREKALELRPGSYVVVGTRTGYRDTRRTLVVPPGRSPEPLTVRCDEVL